MSQPIFGQMYANKAYTEPAVWEHGRTGWSEVWNPRKKKYLPKEFIYFKVNGHFGTWKPVPQYRH